jgi:membrane protein implicated in regulation of membrane protease activity
MESVFFGLFLFGFLMVAASVLLGFAHMALPGDGDGFHIGHGNGGPAHAGGHDDGGGHGHGHDGGGLPIWNVSSALAFVMWFGAAGFVATRWLGFGVLPALAPAVGFGVAGALLVSAFLKLVLRGETEMDPREYRMEGTLAKVTVSIPPQGTGEIVFTKASSRRSEGARSVDGQPIARGEEVVVLDYQHGIALVQPWQDFIADGSARAAEPLPVPEGPPTSVAEPGTEREA